MSFFDISLFTTEFFDFLDSPIWRAWPFNAGYGDHLLPSIARLAFVSLIMGAIVLFLRVLFGPNGYFRDKEMDREADEQRAKERALLEESLAKGEISEAQFQVQMKSLRD